MRRQVRQELASGMGVGHQYHHGAGYRQGKTYRAKALSHCRAALQQTDPLLKFVGTQASLTADAILSLNPIIAFATRSI